MSMQKLCQKKKSSAAVSYQQCNYKCQEEIPSNLKPICIWVHCLHLKHIPNFLAVRSQNPSWFWALVQTSLGNATSILFSTGFFLFPGTEYFLFASSSLRERPVLGNLCQGVPSGFPKVLSATPAQNLSANKERQSDSSWSWVLEDNFRS